MRRITCHVVATFLAVLPIAARGQEDPIGRVRELLRQATIAQRSGDGLAALAAARQAEALLPGHPEIMTVLARACSLAGQPEEALRWVGRVVAAGVDQHPDSDRDLAAVRVLPGFDDLVRRLGALRAPVGAATVAARIPAPDTLAEGVAYDPGTRALFVSSVHRRAVVRIDATGEQMVFAPRGKDTLDGVLGIAVEAPRRSLWACTAALPEMRGFVAGDRGRTSLVAIDLTSGRVTTRVPLPLPPGGASCNDVGIGPNGEVAVADSVSGAVLLLDRAAVRWRELVPAGQLGSPQGLAWSADGARLWVADYGRGLRLVVPATGAVTAVAVGPDATLVGIDGLARAGAALIAVRNGLEPHAVLRIELDPTGTRADRVEVLAANLPEFSEPTLGAVDGDSFVFVANSQWSRFAPEAPAASRKARQDPVLMRLSLPRAGAEGRP